MTPRPFAFSGFLKKRGTGIAPAPAPGYNTLMNWNIIGHEWAVDLLSGQLTAGVLRHAYLFTGPRGIGRRTLARKFAQAINCSEPPAPGDACGACRNCRQIEAQAHPDLAIVEAEAEGRTLKVEQVRELQRSLALAPYAASYRIALLLRFEEAHISAANALLKTLEEPSPRVILLLTADSPENLPETILSRCQLLRLRLLPVETLAARLQEIRSIESPQARLLAHLSGGRPGLALSLIDDPEALAQRQDWLDEHHGLLPATRVTRFAFSDRAAKDRGTVRSMLETWAGYWRDVMILCAGASTSLTNIDRLEELQNVAERLDLSSAHRTLCAIEETRDRIDQNANLRLAVENLMLSLPHL